MTNEQKTKIISLRKQGNSLAEVADKLGISQSYISRLEKKIIARLKVEIEAN